MTTNTMEDVLARMATKEADGTWKIKAAKDDLRNLDRWIKTVTEWKQICDEAQRTGDYTRWSATRVPGKTAKHRAYDRANRIMSLLGLDVERPQNVADLQTVSAAAHKALGR